MDWKTQNELWLENNLKQDAAIQMTEDSLQYKIIYKGNTGDARPQSTSVVYCDYKLHLINGYQVDAGTNSSFAMSSVVKGFAEGLKKIHVHGDIMIYVPWQLGYGKDGQGSEGSAAFIPPYSTLIFEVHLAGVSN